MKNSKLLILNIINYIILYHIVFEIFISLFLQRDIGFTPLGFIFRKFDNLKNNIPFFIIIIISFIINMSVSGILLKYIYKWYDEMSILNVFKKLLLVFVVVSILLFTLLFILALIFKSPVFFMSISFYSPMPIMVILMVPLFKLNRMILGYKD